LILKISIIYSLINGISEPLCT